MLGAVFGLAVLSGCGGGGGNNPAQASELTPGTAMVISIGPAATVDPEYFYEVVYDALNDVYIRIPHAVSKERNYTVVFIAGAGLSGQVNSNGNNWETCIYHVNGDIEGRNYDLEISWGGISGQSERVSLKGVRYKYPDLTGYADSWSTTRYVTVPTGTSNAALVLDGYATFTGTNATIVMGPNS